MRDGQAGLGNPPWGGGDLNAGCLDECSNLGPLVCSLLLSRILGSVWAFNVACKVL